MRSFCCTGRVPVLDTYPRITDEREMDLQLDNSIGKYVWTKTWRNNSIGKYVSVNTWSYYSILFIFNQYRWVLYGRSWYGGDNVISTNKWESFASTGSEGPNMAILPNCPLLQSNSSMSYYFRVKTWRWGTSEQLCGKLFWWILLAFSFEMSYNISLI